MTSEETLRIDATFPTLDVFAWCIQCETLLIGAAKHSSFWGRKTHPIAQTHRRGTNHEVYVGPSRDTTEKRT